MKCLSSFAKPHVVPSSYYFIGTVGYENDMKIKKSAYITYKMRIDIPYIKKVKQPCIF